MDNPKEKTGVIVRKNNIHKYSMDIPKQEKTSEILRRAILQERIPEYLSCVRGEKRSRVLVRTINDLEEYCSFIDSLSLKYESFYGHKKAIGELLGVSTNRIGEWSRIWNAAQKTFNVNKEIQQILKVFHPFNYFLVFVLLVC